MQTAEDVPARAAGPYKASADNSTAYQLIFLPSAYCITAATKFTPIKAPINATPAAPVAFRFSLIQPPLLPLLFSAGAGFCHVNATRTRDATKKME